MKATKPRWSQPQAVFAAQEALKLLDVHGTQLESRLASGLVDGLKTDLATLEGSRTGRPVYTQEGKASTSNEEQVGHDAVDLLSRMREVLKHALPHGHPVLKAVGVGTSISVSMITSVVAALEVMITAFGEYKETFAATGILDADIQECRELHEALVGATHQQSAVKITKKNLTREKDSAQLRIEDAVIAVSRIGALHFRKQAALVAAFEDLIPGPAPKPKKPEPEPEPTPTPTLTPA